MADVYLMRKARTVTPDNYLDDFLAPIVRSLESDRVRMPIALDQLATNARAA